MDSVQPPHPQQPPSAHSSSAAASQPDSARRPSSAKPDDSPAASLFSIPSDVRRAVAAADIVKPAGQTLEEIRADAAAAAAAAAGSVHSSAAGQQSAEALSRTSSLASSKLQGVPASRSRIGALERQPSSESGISTRQAVAAAAAAAIIPAALPHSSHASESPRSLASSPGNEIPRPQEQQQQQQLELSRRSSVASSQHPRSAVPEDSFRTSSSFAFGGGGGVGGGGDAASSPAASNPDALEESANPPPSRSPHNPSSRLSARPDAGHSSANNAAADLERSRRSSVASSHRHGAALDVSQRSGASAARPVALPSAAGGGVGGGGGSVASFGKAEDLHESVRSSVASESRAAAAAPVVQRLSSSRHSIVREDESAAAPGSSPAATLRNDASASGVVSNQPPSRRSSVASSSRREAPPAQHRSAASASEPAAAAAVPRSEPSAAEVDTPEKKTIGQGFDRAAWFEKLRQAERRAASEHVNEPIQPPPPPQPQQHASSASGAAEPARDICMDTSIRDSALGSVAEAASPPRSSHASESPRSLASSPGNEIPRPQEQQLELSRRSSVASSQHPRGVGTSEAPRFAAAAAPAATAPASAGPSVRLSRPDTASAENTARHIPVDPPSHISVRSSVVGGAVAAAAFPSTASSGRETQQGHTHAPPLAAASSEAQQSSTQQSSARTVQHHPEADRESLGGGGGSGSGAAAVSRGSSAARLGSMSMRSRASSAAVPENVLEAEEALEEKVEYVARRSTASSMARWQTGGASLPRWGVGGGGAASASGYSASSPQPSSPPHPRRPPDAAPAVARARAERVRSATKGLGTDEASLFGLAEEIATQAEWDAVRAAFRELHPSVYGGDVSGTLRADLSQAEWERFAGILAARGVAVDAAVPSRPPSFSSSAAVVRAPSQGGSGVEAACPTFEAQAAAMQARQPALYHEACILFGDVVAEIVTGGAGDAAAAAFRRSVVFFGVAARVGHDADGGVKRAKRLVVVTAEAVYTVSVGGRVQRLVPLPSVSEVQYSDTAFGLRVASGFDLSLELSTAAGLFAFVAALKAVAAPTCPFTYLNDAARDLSLGRPPSYVPVRPPSVSLNPLTAALPVEAATAPRGDSAGLVDLGRLLWDPATNTPTFVQTAPAVVTGGASPVRIRGKVVAEGLLVSGAPAAE